MTLHITLTGQPGALTGTITVADRTWPKLYP